MSTNYSFQNTHSKKKKSHARMPNKNFPMSKNLSNQNPMPNKKFSHVQKFLFQPKSHVHQKFSMSKKNSPMSNQNLSMSDTKNPYHHNFFFHTHVHKNVHTHETRLTHSNKISTFIKNEFVQPSLHIKFS